MVKLCALPRAPVTCVLPTLRSHRHGSSGFRATCPADRQGITGHVLKAAGSWPGVAQLLITFRSSFTSFSVPRREGAFRVEGIQGWTAEGQVELASVQEEK